MKKYIVRTVSFTIREDPYHWYPGLDEHGNLEDWYVHKHKSTPEFFSLRVAMQFKDKIQKIRPDLKLEIETLKI